jgi:hypothetical protein
MSDHQDANRIEAAIKDLDLDYMRGLVSEEEYQRKLADLKSKLEVVSETGSGLVEARATLQAPPEKGLTVDPVSAVKQTIQKMRRISIERIAQESGVDAANAARILSDLLDGRELSGRIDYDAGDFILGTGTGPQPKTIAACPYCRKDLDRIAVKGETITCTMCRESFIVS